MKDDEKIMKYLLIWGLVVAFLLSIAIFAWGTVSQTSISDGESGSSVRSKLNNQFPAYGDFTSSNSTGFAWTGESLAVTHGKGLSRAPIVFVLNGESPQELVEVSWEETDSNTITLDFTGFTPISGTWSIVVL